MTELGQRRACIEEAKTWLGTPFVHNASLKGIGVACGPFLVACYVPLSVDADRQLPILSSFPKDWHCHTATERFLAVVESFCIEVETPQPGDLVMFRLGSIGRPFSHGAFIVEWPDIMIHAMWRSGVEYANINQPPLRGAVHKFYSPFSYKAPDLIDSIP